MSPTLDLMFCYHHHEILNSVAFELGFVNHIQRYNGVWAWTEEMCMAPAYIPKAKAQENNEPCTWLSETYLLP